MKLDKAIEIINLDLQHSDQHSHQDHDEAQRLGMEALKRCKTLAANSPLWAAKPLPGETET